MAAVITSRKYCEWNNVIQGPGDRLLSYLPLAHIFDRCALCGRAVSHALHPVAGWVTALGVLSALSTGDESKLSGHMLVILTARSVTEEWFLSVGATIGFWQVRAPRGVAGGGGWLATGGCLATGTLLA